MNLSRPEPMPAGGSSETGWAGAKWLDARRVALVSLLAGPAVLATVFWRGRRQRSPESHGYEEVARWRIAGGEGRFVSVRPDVTLDELRKLGDTLRRDLADVETAVVMVFDDREAAREARRGSRVVGEGRFQAALRHQRAMYEKHAGREHRFVLYERYPIPLEIVGYPAPGSEGTAGTIAKRR